MLAQPSGVHNVRERPGEERRLVPGGIPAAFVADVSGGRDRFYRG
jgi:hypothetical protein